MNVAVQQQRARLAAARLAYRVQPRSPAIVKRRLASLTRAARFLSFDYGFPSVPASLRVFRDLGYQPRFVVDGGAFEGTWTALFRHIYPRARCLMVEPQAGKQPLLERLVREAPAPTRLSNALLGPVDGAQVAFHEMQSGSSVLSELSPWPRHTTTKVTTTLDALLEQHTDWGDPDFIKLDVQGYELAVLDGAPRALERAWFVLLETSFVPYNEGSPLASDVITYMHERGFALADICSQIRRPGGVLGQADLLFIGEACPLKERWLRSASPGLS